MVDDADRHPGEREPAIRPAGHLPHDHVRGAQPVDRGLHASGVAGVSHRGTSSGSAGSLDRQVARGHRRRIPIGVEQVGDLVVGEDAQLDELPVPGEPLLDR